MENSTRPVAAGGTSKDGGKVKLNFMQKLVKMLECSDPQVVRWSPGGESFQVVDVTRCVATASLRVLPPRLPRHAGRRNHRAARDRA
jgi:hypothetical protein